MTGITYCIGWDPGRHIGWAFLEKRGEARPCFMDGGTIEGPDGAEAAIADRLRATLALVDHRLIVGVETIRGFVHARPGRGAKAMTKHINEASELAGVIVGMAMGMTLRVVKVPATDWKRTLGLPATASDASVKMALSVLVLDLPKVSNAHLRDAVGCAFGALQRTESVRMRA